MEKGQAAQEGLEDAIRSCRKKGREEKAQFELNLANSVRGKKSVCTNTLTRAEENHHSSLDTGRNIFTKDREAADVPYTFLASVFKCRIDYHQDNWPPDLGDREGMHSGTPLRQKEAVQDLLRHRDAHMSLGLDGIHAREIRQLGQEVIKSGGEEGLKAVSDTKLELPLSVSVPMSGLVSVPLTATVPVQGLVLASVSVSLPVLPSVWVSL